MSETAAKVWLDYDQEALDRQYDQRVLVPNADDYKEREAEMSAQVRERLDCRLDVAYGPSPDEVLDIFPAAQPNAPFVIYIHGGAWTRWHKDDNSYQAPAFVERGITYLSVNFSLVPGVALEEQVRQCRAAVQWAWNNAENFGADPDRMYLAGHSSGAHVVGLLTVTDWAKDWDLPADAVKGSVAVSGMYDMAPVRLSSRNGYLHLDDAAEARLSAMRQIPDRMPPMIVAYGGKEQIEFRRHSKDWAAELKRLGHGVTEIDVPGLNHFDMAELLADPESDVMKATYAMIGA